MINPTSGFCSTSILVLGSGFLLQLLILQSFFQGLLQSRDVFDLQSKEADAGGYATTATAAEAQQQSGVDLCCDFFVLLVLVLVFVLVLVLDLVLVLVVVLV